MIIFNSIGNPTGQTLQKLKIGSVVLVLLGIIGFNSWHLFPETMAGIPTIHDMLFHLLLVESAADAIINGRDFTDPWQGTMSMGFAVFHHYQHLPHLIVALVHVFTLEALPINDLLKWTTYILLVLFPISIYSSIRIFGFDHLTAVMGALVAPIVGNDFQEYGGFGYWNYTFEGWSLYAQLWGMFILPVALASGYRLIRYGGGYFWPVLLLSGLLMSHLLFGYMAFLTLGVLTLVPVVRLRISKASFSLMGAQLTRLIILVLFVCGVTSYFLILFWLDHGYFNPGVSFSRVYLDSFGHELIIPALIKGDLFDSGRFPTLSILVVLGIVSCFYRKDGEKSLIPLYIFVMWLLLFFGRATWGQLIDLLPLSQDMAMQRFIAGVHLGGIFLAACGLGSFWRLSMEIGNKWYIVGIATVTLVILSPAYFERSTYLSRNAEIIRENKKALSDERLELDRMIEYLEKLPNGRTFAGLDGLDEWGKQYKIGSVTVSDLLSAHGLDIFSTPHRYSLPSDVSLSFDETRLDHYDLFNIKYVVAPESKQFPDFVKPIRQFGRHHLFRVDTTGYFDLVSSGLVFTGTKKEFVKLSRSWLEGSWPTVKNHPEWLMDDLGRTKGNKDRIPTGDLYGDNGLTHLRGTLDSEEVGSYRFASEVSVERESLLLLKISFHPNWHVTVNGNEKDTLLLMPGFVAVQLEPGQHEVMMEYRSPDERKILAILGAALLILLGLWNYLCNKMGFGSISSILNLLVRGMAMILRRNPKF